jgi:uncharacterized membrane protein
MRSPRHGHAGQVPAVVQLALSTVARPNPVVFIWRWRYELALVTCIPTGMIALTWVVGVAWTLTGTAVLGGAIAMWPAARRYLAARAWCIITPHRVRTGCVQAWIHSRRGKIPIVLLTTRQPYGERLYLWCRAGTCAENFTAARHLLIAACWARDIHVAHSQRFTQLVTLDVIRHEPCRPKAEGSTTAVQPGNRSARPVSGAPRTRRFNRGPGSSLSEIRLALTSRHCLVSRQASDRPPANSALRRNRRSG